MDTSVARKNRGAPVPRKWTMEQVTQSLTALALTSGSPKAAIELVKEVHGFDITNADIQNFKRTYGDEYSRVLAEVTPRLEEEMAEGNVRMARAYEQTEAKLLERLDSKVDELDAKDLAGAVRNVAVSKAVNIDKHQQLTGRSNPAGDNRNAEEILKSIAAQFKGVVTVREVEIRTEDPNVIDATAQEITDESR